MNERGKTSFIIHSRHVEVFKDLPGDDVKSLMLAIGEYVGTEKEPDFANNSGLLMAFRFIRVDLDKEAARWEETKKKRIEAGRKGGIASAASREQAKQTEQI
jgi:hypothetical protein